MAGEIVLPEVTHIAFGNEGHDTEGEPIDPDPDWEEVPGELMQKEFESANSDGYIVEMVGKLEQDELVGEDISAAGTYDDDGDLLAVATFSPLPKGEDDEMIFNWDTIF